MDPFDWLDTHRKGSVVSPFRLPIMRRGFPFQLAPCRGEEGESQCECDASERPSDRIYSWMVWVYREGEDSVSHRRHRALVHLGAR
jgi:hypothetical protein